MALRLTLKPGEKAAINGAVISNGERRTSFVIENKACVLRESDIMQPHECDTPAKRIYFAIILLYIGEGAIPDLRKDYENRLTEFVGALSAPTALAQCSALAAHVANGDYYKALIICRSLIEFEEERLSHVG